MKFLHISLNRYILPIFSFLIISYDNAYAYIDPSTGSYILQMLLAGLLGALFVLKTYWRNLKSFFSKKSSDDEK